MGLPITLIFELFTNSASYIDLAIEVCAIIPVAFL
jgi:hypothetical protein